MKQATPMTTVVVKRVKYNGAVSRFIGLNLNVPREGMVSAVCLKVALSSKFYIVEFKDQNKVEVSFICIYFFN